MQVHIKNPELFAKKKQAIQEAGKSLPLSFLILIERLLTGLSTARKRQALFRFWEMVIILARIMLKKHISSLIIIML